MLKIDITGYIQLGQEIADASMNFYMMGQMDAPDNKPRPDETAEVIALLKKIQRHCAALDLPISRQMIEHAIEDPPETQREFDQYVIAVRTELRNKLFLFVPPHNAKYFEKSISITGFPKASSELSRAANCYAVSEPTACVFHSMRAAELALRAIAEALEVEVPLASSQWNQLIEQVEAKIAAIGKQPRSAARTEDQTFFSEAAAQFRYIKDAWRNHVSHARVTYSEAQALAIFEHSTDLISTLASRFAEVP